MQLLFLSGFVRLHSYGNQRNYVKIENIIDVCVTLQTIVF